MNNKIVITKDFQSFIKAFSEENSKINLVSKNDEKLLYEKHIYDSLAIKLFFEKYGENFKNILDIGCGGGFPCVPIAIEYPYIEIVGVDSIQKKIDAVNNFKAKLKINNLELVCGRIENLNLKKFDIVISRAVADLSKIFDYALPHLKKDGYFIAYKSKKADEEIEKAENLLKKSNAEIMDIIEYTLPLEEIYERKLICIKLMQKD